MTFKLGMLIESAHARRMYAFQTKGLNKWGKKCARNCICLHCCVLKTPNFHHYMRASFYLFTNYIHLMVLSINMRLFECSYPQLCFCFYCVYDHQKIVPRSFLVFLMSLLARYNRHLFLVRCLCVRACVSPSVRTCFRIWLIRVVNSYICTGLTYMYIVLQQKISCL